MTPEEQLRAEARRVIARSVKAQGLPRTIRDPRTLETVAAIVRAERGRRREAS